VEKINVQSESDPIKTYVYKYIKIMFSTHVLHSKQVPRCVKRKINKNSSSKMHSVLWQIYSYLVLPNRALRLCLEGNHYGGKRRSNFDPLPVATDWKTLSRLGIVCKDWNEAMCQLHYETIIQPPSDNALISQIKSTPGGPRLVDLTNCHNLTAHSIKYLDSCTNLRVLIYRNIVTYYGELHEPLANHIIDVVKKLLKNKSSRLEKLLVKPENIWMKDIVDRSWHVFRPVLKTLKYRSKQVLTCTKCAKTAKVTCDVCDMTMCENHSPKTNRLCDFCGLFFCEQCNSGEFEVRENLECDERYCYKDIPPLNTCGGCKRSVNCYNDKRLCASCHDTCFTSCVKCKNRGYAYKRFGIEDTPGYNAITSCKLCGKSYCIDDYKGEGCNHIRFCTKCYSYYCGDCHDPKEFAICNGEYCQADNYGQRTAYCKFCRNTKDSCSGCGMFYCDYKHCEGDNDMEECFECEQSICETCQNKKNLSLKCEVCRFDNMRNFYCAKCADGIFETVACACTPDDLSACDACKKFFEDPDHSWFKKNAANKEPKLIIFECCTKNLKRDDDNNLIPWCEKVGGGG